VALRGKFSLVFSLVVFVAFVVTCLTYRDDLFGLLVNKCPSKSRILEIVKKDFRGEVLVESVNETPIAGLCEAVLNFGNGRNLLYVDSRGRYVVVGRIVDVQTNKDLTRDRLFFLNLKRLSKSEMNELEKYVAFTFGDADRHVYLVGDPDCSFCKMVLGELEELAKEGKVKVSVVLFPVHESARKKAIALICDGKGLNEFKSGYVSKNQCEKGKKVIENTFKLMQDLKVDAVPAIVFPGGELIVGAMPASEILSKYDEIVKK
jgi:thiol:disulfide interchange protein DsbC